MSKLFFFALSPPPPPPHVLFSCFHYFYSTFVFDLFTFCPSFVFHLYPTLSSAISRLSSPLSPFIPVLTDPVNMTDMKTFSMQLMLLILAKDRHRSQWAVCVGVCVSVCIIISLHVSVSASGSVNVPVCFFMYTQYLHKTVHTCKWASGEPLHQQRRLSLLINLRCVLIQYRSSQHPPSRELRVPTLCRLAMCSSPTNTFHGVLSCQLCHNQCLH